MDSGSRPKCGVIVRWPGSVLRRVMRKLCLSLSALLGNDYVITGYLWRGCALVLRRAIFYQSSLHGEEEKFLLAPCIGHMDLDIRDR